MGVCHLLDSIVWTAGPMSSLRRRLCSSAVLTTNSFEAPHRLIGLLAKEKIDRV
jgi:hypothetical protein